MISKFLYKEEYMCFSHLHIYIDFIDIFLRQLLMQYARYRAALGAKYNRTDWASLPDLPASPSHCRKRIASLKSNLKFRKSLMRLCNILSERYAKFLERMQGQSLDKADCRLKGSRKPGLIRNLFNGNEHFQETCLQEEAWDDFENISVKLSFDEVLRCKKQAKFDSSERVRFTSEGWSDLNMDGEECVSTNFLTFFLQFYVSVNPIGEQFPKFI